MIGPNGVPVSDAAVYSNLNPQDQLGMSADDGTLSIAMCEAENITAVKEDLIYQSTEFPGGNSIIVHMRVNLNKKTQALICFIAIMISYRN